MQGPFTILVIHPDLAARDLTQGSFHLGGKHGAREGVRGFRRFRRAGNLAAERFGLPDVQPLCRHLVSGGNHLFLTRKPQDCLGVSGAEFPRADLLADIVRQAEQAHRVRNRTAALAQSARGLLLRQTVAVNQLAAALGHFDGVKVLTLEIFNQCEGGGLFIGHFLDKHRHFLKPCHPRGAPAALPRNDDIPRPGLFGPHRDGLKQAILRNAGGQRRQRFLIKVLARLVGVGFDLPQRKPRHIALTAVLGRQVLKQAVKAFAQTAQLAFCHSLSLPSSRAGVNPARCSAKIPAPSPYRLRFPCRSAHRS